MNSTYDRATELMRENLRAAVQIPKPRIRWLGARWAWGCGVVGDRSVGFGDTPSEAYQQWVRQIADRLIDAPRVTR